MRIFFETIKNEHIREAQFAQIYFANNVMTSAARNDREDVTLIIADAPTMARRLRPKRPNKNTHCTRASFLILIN